MASPADPRTAADPAAAWTALITRYHHGCSAGDVDPMPGTLHPDVVHRFLAPDTGSEPAAHPGHVEGRIASARRRPPSWTR